MSGYSKEHLRSIVRDALKEAVSGGKEQNAKPNKSASAFARKLRATIDSRSSAPLTVDLSDRRKLNEFLKELVGAAQDRDIQSAIASGKLIFDASHSKSANGAARGRAAVNNVPENSGNGDYLYENGMLSESKIIGIAKHHQRVIVGKSVVVTPLARDRARTVNLKIVRQEQ